MTVDVAGVNSAQRIIITLSNVTDDSARVLADTQVIVGILLGDTTGNGSVNSSDISQTKSQSGQPIPAANFREDVTINGSDNSLVKSKSGSALRP